MFAHEPSIEGETIASFAFTPPAQTRPTRADVWTANEKELAAEDMPIGRSTDEEFYPPIEHGLRLVNPLR